MRARVALPLLLAACGGPRETHRVLFVQAQEPDRTPEEATTLCSRIELVEERDACLLELVRSRADLPGSTCQQLEGARPAADCWFLTAEHHAATGNRWDALEACGRAGPYLNECLYHAWTRELQAIARSTDALAQALDDAKDPLAYWGTLDSAGPDQAQRVLGDFWYFWWLHHPPADPAACAAIVPERRDDCQAGTLLFVERSVDMALREHKRGDDLLDRSCRAGSVPAFVLDGRAVDEPAVREASTRALARLCEQGPEAARPWNPVFQTASTR